jgi:hypothetical protein
LPTGMPETFTPQPSGQYHLAEVQKCRRQLLQTTGAALCAPLLPFLRAEAAIPQVRVTGFELLPIRATSRTVWLMVRLRTDAGLVGLGEASDAFGFANTTAADATRSYVPIRCRCKV